MYIDVSLENLVKAVKGKNPEEIEDAVAEAIEALGFDPSAKEQLYTVSLKMAFYKTRPEDAVKEFIRAIEETRDGWFYIVEDEKGGSHTVDTYYWDR